MNKQKNQFYNFLMIRVIPAVLKRWTGMDHDVKWHMNRKVYFMWYHHQLKIYWMKHDWIGVIICAIICMFQKEKLK